MESIADTVKGAVGDVQPVNLFPRTAHCETVVLLSREKADDYIRISGFESKGELTGKLEFVEIICRKEM